MFRLSILQLSPWLSDKISFCRFIRRRWCCRCVWDEWNSCRRVVTHHCSHAARFCTTPVKKISILEFINLRMGHSELYISNSFWVLCTPNDVIVKILKLYIILSCTHLPLLLSTYPFKAMHSLLVTLIIGHDATINTGCTYKVISYGARAGIWTHWRGGNYITPSSS